LKQPELTNQSNAIMDRIVFIGLAIQTILSISIHITKELTELDIMKEISESDENDLPKEYSNC